MSNFLNFFKNKTSINNILTEKVKEDGISKIIIDNLKDIEETVVLDKYYDIIQQNKNCNGGWYKYYNKLKENEIEKHENFLKSLIKLKVITISDWVYYINQKKFKINFDLILKNKDIIKSNLICILCTKHELFKENNYSIEYEEMFLRTFKDKLGDGGFYLGVVVKDKYSKEFQEEILNDY